MSLAADDPLFAGLDSAEAEILEREIREGRVRRFAPKAPAAVKPLAALGSDFADTRDKRDPAKLGDVLLHKADQYGSIINAANHATLDVPNFDPSQTTVTETVRKRRAELETRAAAGDKFAQSMLETGLPGDSGE